jgi:arginase
MQIELVAVPSGLGLMPRGVERAPAALRDAGLAARLGARRAHTVPVPPWSPRRDDATGLLNPDRLVVMATRLADTVSEVLAGGGFPVVLGGDCSILLGPMLALRRRGRYGLLHVDGHADFWHPSQEDMGEAASLDLALVTGRGPDIVTNLEGLVPLVRDDDVAQLGYRSAENDSYLKVHVRDTAITVHDLGDVRRDGIVACTAGALAVVAGDQLDGFWLHLDVDVLDDELMPAVDYREPAGLTWEEAEHVLAAAAASGRLCGVQLTIYNPLLDGPAAPLAARIVEMLAAGIHQPLSRGCETRYAPVPLARPPSCDPRPR